MCCSGKIISWCLTSFCYIQIVVLVSRGHLQWLWPDRIRLMALPLVSLPGKPLTSSQIFVFYFRDILQTFTHIVWVSIHAAADDHLSSWVYLPLARQVDHHVIAQFYESCRMCSSIPTLPSLLTVGTRPSLLEVTSVALLFEDAMLAWWTVPVILICQANGHCWFKPLLQQEWAFSGKCEAF